MIGFVGFRAKTYSKWMMIKKLKNMKKLKEQKSV